MFVAYILRISLCCVVRASHDQAGRGRRGAVAGLFSLLQHHGHWLWGVKRHLPDTMCCTRGLWGRNNIPISFEGLPNDTVITSPFGIPSEEIKLNGVTIII